MVEQLPREDQIMRGLKTNPPRKPFTSTGMAVTLRKSADYRVATLEAKIIELQAEIAELKKSK
jgi:hypothetical protein